MHSGGERARHAQSHEMAEALRCVQRKAVGLRKELRASRKARRDAVEVVEAAKAAKHNAEVVLRAQLQRRAGAKPLGISRPPPG